MTTKAAAAEKGESTASRTIITVGWDGQSNPIRRYKDEQHLADHLQTRISNAALKYTSVTTKHDKIGYTCNVDVIETALRERFGFNDNSYVIKAVAAHIWSQVCGTDNATWNQEDIEFAIASCTARLQKMRASLVFQS
jgi:hypothetical protein